MTGSDSHKVNYAALDPFKVAAQVAARETDTNITRLGLEVVRESRGESVFLIRSVISGATPELIGGVTESLGTKNLVADAVRTAEASYYDFMAQDAVAMIVNDMATLGVLPVAIGPCIAVGSSEWFDDEQRAHDLISGWKHSCDLARSVYGPGETATLSGLVSPDSAVISGFALGVVPEDVPRVGGTVRAGDAIITLASSGIHANGLTNARSLASQLPDGYATDIGTGQSLGESLVVPTPIYSPVIEDILRRGARVSYTSNITGHGWRKLMRCPAPLRYVVEAIPPVPPVLQFLADRLDMPATDAYGTWNMGAGFALFVRPEDTSVVIDTAADHRMDAMVVGEVRDGDGARSVEIGPVGVTYDEGDLNVR